MEENNSEGDSLLKNDTHNTLTGNGYGVVNEKEEKTIHCIVDDDDENVETRRKPIQPRSSQSWNPSALTSYLSRKRSSKNSRTSLSPKLSTRHSFSEDKQIVLRHDSTFVKKSGKRKNTIVNVVLVKAKGLPDPPDDGSSHDLYCKISLGSESFKSKAVTNVTQPVWRDKFKLHLHKDHFMKISLWDKGKQKNFMGSCTVDLSTLERDRTHDIWQELDNGFGSVQFTVTMCEVLPTDAPQNNNEIQHLQQRFVWDNFDPEEKVLGQLFVKIVGARGLYGKPSAYCTLEVDNERVQTHAARASAEPVWNKHYVFNIFDVTSTLNVKLYDDSLISSLLSDSLGRVSIPLLRIQNGENRWFALKDVSQRKGAKGNCPRVLLEMSMNFNPVKASLRLFQPRDIKHIKKPPKFDMNLIYRNLEITRSLYKLCFDINETYKRLFEWDNVELSFVALLGWLVFWLYIKLWAVPLLLLGPFIFFWVYRANKNDSTLRAYRNSEDGEWIINSYDKNEKGITGKLLGLQELSLSLTSSIEYMTSLIQRVQNLVTFEVPYLSFLTMILLCIQSATLYFVPFNYLMMGFGIFKFTRKYFKPDRLLNSDILDYLSRVPDNETLKDWQELSVPEPNRYRFTGLSRTNSNASNSSTTYSMTL